jgi:hypothetical protein
MELSKGNRSTVVDRGRSGLIRRTAARRPAGGI